MERVALIGAWANAQKKWILFLITMFVVIFTVLASAPKALADKFMTETSSSTRALGMGDAAINTERGPNSIFYNPANIAAKNTGTNTQFVNIQMDTSEGFLSELSKDKVPNVMSLSTLYNELKSNPGSYSSGRFSVFPNFTIRDFSLGMLYEVNQGALVDPITGDLRVKARDRFTPVAAFSFRLFSGILRIGVSAQYLTVGNADSIISSPSTVPSLDFKNSIDSRAGLSKTAGVTVTLPVRYLPSFSIVARDIGNTAFTLPPLVKFGTGSDVPVQHMTFDAATSLTLYLARRIEMVTEIDYRDTVNELHGGRFRHVFLGTEFIAFDFFRFRAGMMSGYLSGGFGIKTPKASLDLAVYSEEIDDRLRGQKETRYALQYTWTLFK